MIFSILVVVTLVVYLGWREIAAREDAAAGVLLIQQPCSRARGRAGQLPVRVVAAGVHSESHLGDSLPNGSRRRLWSSSDSVLQLLSH